MIDMENPSKRKVVIRNKGKTLRVLIPPLTLLNLQIVTSLFVRFVVRIMEMDLAS